MLRKVTGKKNGETPVEELRGVWLKLLFDITPRFTLTRNGSTYRGLIYGLNRFVKKLFLFDETVNKND